MSPSEAQKLWTSRAGGESPRLLARGKRIPTGAFYNSLRSKINVGTPWVRRDPKLYMFSHRTHKVHTPTVNDIILGQSFIDMSTVLEYDWQAEASRAQIILTNLLKNEDKTWEEMLDHLVNNLPDLTHFNNPHFFREMFCSALEQCVNYYYEFGEVDGDDGAPRLPRIGDTVSYHRTSSDDLMEVYGEPTEDRPTRCFNAPHPYAPDRADGDARWQALQDGDYNVIADGGRWLPSDQCPVDPDGFVQNKGWTFVPRNFLAQ